MKSFRQFFLVSFSFFVCTNSYTQTKKDTLSIEQSLSRYTMRTPVFSPDGSSAAVVISQSGLGDNLPASHIWMVDIASNTIRQFTSSAKSETDPQWSPDGRMLSFLSGRNGIPQIFLMNADGGEASPLTASKTAISSYAWNPAGKTIAYLTEDPPTAAEEKRAADKFDETVASESDKPTRIFMVDVNSKTAVRVSKQNLAIEEMKWMPDGKAILLLTQALPAAEVPEFRLSLMSLKDSSVSNLPCPSHAFWGQINISPDGNSIVYHSSPEDGPDAQDLFIQSLKNGIAKNITSKSLDLPIRFSKFTDNHHVLALVQKGFTTKLYNISDTGKAIDYGIDQQVGAFDISGNGTILFESYSGNQLSELWLMGTDKKPVQVSHFNKIFDNIALAAPRIIRYKSFDGLLIEASLYKPSTNGNKPLPLVVFIHGGPTGAFVDSYNAWVQLFVQKGYAVFCPNIRGSTGYGWKFLTSNRNDWGGNDFKDIMAGVDMLIAKENIDSNRMGISGWSYGGFMAEWAITQTNRFKAAMSGAGLANLASEFGTESNASYDRWFFGTPYENPENFSQHSPVTFMKNAKTPTLIIQGENDKTDPVGQSQELYRGLRYYHVPTELILYPREPYGFREIKHNIDFYTRMLAWFDKYVMGQ